MNTLTVLEASEPQVLDDSAERCLVERCRGGDPEAFDEIVALYHERVARVACRLLGQSHDIDDVVQDVFLGVLKKIHTFRADASFSTWLIAITVNRCRSQLRRQALHGRMMSILRKHPTQGDTRRHNDRSGDLVVRVQDAIRQMPATYREPIVLRYLEELSIREIAEVLKISTSAVEVRLSRGRQRLKLRLSDRNCQ
jgi:RNA polymerase sigma-70 factor (ECF subfamily)